MRRLALTLIVSALCLSAGAHPMGNFAISHYSRLEVRPEGRLQIHYVLDRAEIPTVAEKAALDSNGDGLVTEPERATYLAEQVATLVSNLHLSGEGKALPLTLTDSKLRLTPGAGGLDTLRIDLELEGQLPVASDPCEVRYRDDNFPQRTGWKELIIAAEGGVNLAQSSAPSIDRSAALTRYPKETVPPQNTEASFTIADGPSLAAAAARPMVQTPSDRFTQSISQVTLTPLAMLVGLLVAFVYGGFHALGPGHGKTMVAAYLVGARGTIRHAALLGIVVTITHTLGVFSLGLATLFASRYGVPERLYPILSALSGLSVFGVGIWLLHSRLGKMPHHGHGDEGEHDHALPEGPVTPRTLIALGVSGGLVPCPSALIVLLSSIALHRIGYGMALVTSFSLGLAAVLIVIGLFVVTTRDAFARLPQERHPLRRIPREVREHLGRLLPVLSAGAVALTGLALTLRAFPAP